MSCDVALILGFFNALFCGQNKPVTAALIFNVTEFSNIKTGIVQPFVFVIVGYSVCFYSSNRK